MNIKKEMVINRPVDEVWEVLGNQFADAYKWARGLNHSEGHGKQSFGNATFDHRTCEVDGFGKIQEVLKRFDPENYVLTYEVAEGFPGFISSAVNTWSLSEEGSKTKVNMHLVMETTGIKGTLMGPMMKMQLNKTVAGVVSDLKAYVETGRPSKQKEKEIAKMAKKAA